MHKSILSGRSDVFAAMLGNHDLVETKANRLTIKDIKPGALKEMLRFLYTEKVSGYLLQIQTKHFLAVFGANSL